MLFFVLVRIISFWKHYVLGIGTFVAAAPCAVAREAPSVPLYFPRVERCSRFLLRVG